MRILVVEDELKIANAIKRGLERQSYAVDVAYDGVNGLAMATTEPYDLIILDIMLPGGIDGLGILKKIRQDKIFTPVLFLTAKDKVLDRTEGLNAGADDYLVKPFAFIELIARVRALLRRMPNTVSTRLEYQDLIVDPENKLVERSGKKILLTNKEFALLEYLIRNPGRVMTKDELMQHVWDYNAEILPNTIEVYIGYLRNKIDKPFVTPPLIKTRRGFGYYLGGN